jgi:hypothetical protein
MRILVLLLFAVSLAACTTPYQPDGTLGGYSETPLASNAFKVTFRANGYTSVEQATDFTLLRAADLTLEKGYAYFVTQRPMQSGGFWDAGSHYLEIACYAERPQTGGIVYDANVIYDSMVQKYKIAAHPVRGPRMVDAAPPPGSQPVPVASAQRAAVVSTPMVSASSVQSAQAKAAAAARDCQQKRLSGELHGYVESANCSGPAMVSAYQEINYPYMDLIYLTSAYRVAVYNRVDRGQLSEAQATLWLSEFTGRISGEQARRQVARSSAQSAPPEIVNARAFQQIVNGMRQSQGIGCEGADSAVRCE